MVNQHVTIVEVIFMSIVDWPTTPNLITFMNSEFLEKERLSLAHCGMFENQ